MRLGFRKFIAVSEENAIIAMGVDIAWIERQNPFKCLGGFQSCPLAIQCHSKTCPAINIIRVEFGCPFE